MLLTYYCCACKTPRKQDQLKIVHQPYMSTNGVEFIRVYRYCADNPKCKPKGKGQT